MAVNPNYSRTKKQREDDFEFCAEQRKLGKTWANIYYAICTDPNRPYTITLDKLKEDYYKKSRDFSSSVEETAKIQFQAMVDDCDALMLEAMQGFERSRQGSEIITNKGKVSKKSGAFIPSSRVVKEMMSHGDTKWLDMFLKAMDQKQNILSKIVVKKVDVESFTKLLEDNPIDDDFGFKSEPIQSESDLDG
jgi:hypothetical protein